MTVATAPAGPGPRRIHTGGTGPAFYEAELVAESHLLSLLRLNTKKLISVMWI